jgi:hypothetical protein
VVSEHLKEIYAQPDVFLVTIYCDYEDRENQTLENMFLSVIHQMVEQLPAIPQEICQIYQRGSHRDSRNQIIPSIRNLLLALQHHLKHIRTVFIVLDALDEGTQQVQDQLVAKIRKLYVQDLRLICMSRPLPKLKGLFQEAESIPISARAEDLSLFIKNRIHRVQSLKMHIAKAESLEREILESVVRMADGM